MESIFDMAKQKVKDRGVKWSWSGPKGEPDSSGDAWGERVNLHAWHDKERKQFRAYVQLVEWSERTGCTMERFTMFESPTATILTVPVGRYSAGAFSQFLAAVRDKCAELAAYGSEGTGGELLRKAAQLVNGTVTA